MSKRFILGDDGTLDTVIIDTETGEEHRFNYQNSGFEPEDDETDEQCYDRFVESCIEELESEI